MSQLNLAQTVAHIGSQDGNGKDDAAKSEKVSLNTLSDLAGFPLEFVKRELVLQEDEISLDKLRSSILDYLDEAFLGVDQ